MVNDIIKHHDRHSLCTADRTWFTPSGSFAFPTCFLHSLVCPFLFPTHKTTSKSKKKTSGVLANLKKGDRVVTTGGIWGTVVEIGDETVTLKVDANTRITLTKEAIAHYQH